MNQPSCRYKVPGLNYQATDGLWYPCFEDSPDCELFIKSVELAIRKTEENLYAESFQNHGNGD